jgi:hypothetical protein
LPLVTAASTTFMNGASMQEARVASHLSLPLPRLAFE